LAQPGGRGFFNSLLARLGGSEAPGRFSLRCQGLKFWQLRREWFRLRRPWDCRAASEAEAEHSKHFLDYERGFPKKAEINARQIFADNAENAKLHARKQENDYGKKSETAHLASVQQV
jgi:hypothetical protein